MEARLIQTAVASRAACGTVGLCAKLYDSTSTAINRYKQSLSSHVHSKTIHPLQTEGKNKLGLIAKGKHYALMEQFSEYDSLVVYLPPVVPRPMTVLKES